MSLLTKIFGDYSKREVKKVKAIADKVIALEEEFAALSDEELKAKTPYLKERLENGETTDDILPEAFAACREAAWRVLKMKHFPVQVIGGIVLHQGRIAEMRTGEGKTLVATLPAYLNALTGNGVHVVTVNEYLARRDSEWMGKIFSFMGLKVGLVYSQQPLEEKQKAYLADITYGTSNEMGFDYLRDNMAKYRTQRVQRGHIFAIVDEVDSILIDEARTPLIISGMGSVSSDIYKSADDFAKRLTAKKITEMESKTSIDEAAGDADYLIDEKARTATLTTNGIRKAEAHFSVENLMDAENTELLHHINQAIKARGVMKRDENYIVKDGEVFIVDEFTGRTMVGRRYSEGLHQAIEAKEGVKLGRENKTLATITLQNYFRLYKKLSGMTGTAMTEKDEFQEIYALDIVEIPTNRPMIRKDHSDVMYVNEERKFNAVIEQIKTCHEKGQPVLVGTVSIDKSEALSRVLKKNGIKHEVLNAKQHEREAEIVAQAGKPGAVTIATNMAGRGTDIILGGNAEFMALNELKKRDYPELLINEATGFSKTDDEEILAVRQEFKELKAKYEEQLAPDAEKVRQAGGLFIIGTVRHDARRIDNQLRGRAGRQGDPGESRFYIAADDDLMRVFGGDRFERILKFFKTEDMGLEASLFDSAVENAQKRVESNHFAARKHTINFDDVINKQREIVYAQRDQVHFDLDIDETIRKMIRDSISDNVDFYCADGAKPEQWNMRGLEIKYSFILGGDNLADCKKTGEIKDKLIGLCEERLAEIHEEFGDEKVKELEQFVLLHNVDEKWMDHIDAMDQLKRGISLRAYANQDPIVAFRQQTYDMFDDMSSSIREETVRMLFSYRVKREEDIKRTAVKTNYVTSGGSETEKKKPVVKGQKVGRNDPCPCGSGKKYKHCCLGKE